MTHRTAPEVTGGGAKGPDELRQQLEHARGRLGRTVEELADKAHLKTRAADLKDKAGAMTVQLRSSASKAGHTVEHNVPRPVANVVQAGLRHPRPVVVAGAAAGAVVAAGLLRRRHNGHH
ncbi:DUF3618 domain-containing protein [Streptomyces sp. NBC_00444]|uniref:DUF3618 domain-containing protein n=1 Tax=Streptomyces sp. NBC_00444 TaxID=2975744 RepID=UPI002E227A1A